MDITGPLSIKLPTGLGKALVELYHGHFNRNLDKMLSVLQDRMQHDPSSYIRLQSAAAIRDLGPRGKF